MTLGLCTTYDLKKKSLFSNSSTISWTIRKFSHRFEMKMYGWISLRRVVISMNLYSTCSVHCCHHHRHLVLRFGVHMSTINQSKIVQNAPFIASNTPSLQHNHCEIPLHTINNSSRTILHTLTHTHTSDIFRRHFSTVIGRLHCIIVSLPLFRFQMSIHFEFIEMQHASHNKCCPICVLFGLFVVVVVSGADGIKTGFG